MAEAAEFWEPGIHIRPGAPPAGDVIFIPCDDAGSPGPLNTYILEALGLSTSLIPHPSQLLLGYWVIHEKASKLVFVVTVGRGGGTPQLLTDNLRSALRDRSLKDASHIWLPLMGTGAGHLTPYESLGITRYALDQSGWIRSDVSITIAPPANADLEELGVSAPAAEPVEPLRRRARRKGAPPEARTVDASVFYASPSEWNSEWLAALRPGKIMFWIKNGGSHLKRFRRGHAVVLLAGRDVAEHPGRGAIVAFGVQTAGPERHFEDDEKNRRWPVTITHVFDREQFPRSLIEDQTGLLLRAAAGGVHSLDSLQTEILSLILASAGVPPFPLNDEVAETLLARGQSIEEALAAYPYIHEVGQPVPIPAPVKIDGGEEKKEQKKEPPPPPFDAQSEYLSDTPAHDVDLLDRGEFAVALARRLHDIWCRRNGLWPKGVKADKTREDLEIVADDTFIVHVDAPWGGGKTTFANFVAQVLNPRGARLRAAHFLNNHVADLPKTPPPSLDGVFLGDYSPTGWEPHPRDGRRPWTIVRSNAWRYQDVEPPWWQIYLDVAQAIRRAALDDFRRHAGILASPRAGRTDRLRAAGGMASALWRWARAKLLGVTYQISNTRLLKHLTLTVVAFCLFALSLKVVPWKRWTSDGAVDPAKIKALIEFGLLGLGALGGGLAAFGTLLSQSLAPDLDFSGETKRIGVGDPIARFRKTFRKMLELGRRPVLLIVDDLDRCAPKHVVELLRGFQTILQSPRMFVMILGDRHWIETAHSVWHADMKGLALGPEASLGGRFVEKVFQLSFVLPAMSREARDRYTRAQLGEPGQATQTPPPAATKLAQEVETALNAPAPAAEREKKVHDLIQQAKAGGDADEAEVEAVQADAASRITVDAVGDVELTGRTEKLLAGLAPLLPNNPRQIKRVINAFPLFAAVGARFFGYRAPGLLSTDDDTRAWRQLALWVALSTEWPVTWRALAARPLLLDAAYAPEAADREAAVAALSAGGDDKAKAEVEGEARRLRADPALARLLGACALPESAGRAAMLFGATRVEPASVREFNRIIWEAGFDVGETAP